MNVSGKANITAPHIWNAKDYIIDGLVEIWDGIENVEYGKHSNTTTVWKGLLGKIDLSLVGDNVSWAQDHVYGMRDNNSYFQNMSVSSDLTDVFRGSCKGLTMEVVANYTRTGWESVFDFWPKYTDGSTGWMILPYSDRRLQVMLCQNVYGVVSTSFFPDDNRVSLCSISVKYGEQAKTYCNSVFKGSISTSPQNGVLKGQAFQKFILGGKANNGTYPMFGGHMHCLRLYSKPLSEEEIAWNFNVDKERFNLVEEVSK